MRRLAVAAIVICGVCAHAQADDLVRPEIELITFPPVLRGDGTGFADELIDRARQQLIAAHNYFDPDVGPRLVVYANAHLDLAIALLERHRPRTVRDYVLIGYAHRLARRELRGTDADRALVELCWRCREAADAHVRLGDHAFADAGDAASLAPAVEHFAAAAAIDAASADVRAYAEYKLAWCLYNQHDEVAAVAHLRAALWLTGDERFAVQVDRDMLIFFAKRP